MSAQVTILQLPSAGAITGAESVPIVQNGVTVQTTTGAIAASPSQPYTYLTVTQTPQLANSRYVGATNGLSITDGGAQGLFNITTTGALLSLVNSGTGFQVKTSSTAITGRSIATSGVGLSTANGNGIAGDPTITLAGQVLNLANLSANGLMTITTAGALSATQIANVANQTSVSNADGTTGSPTVGLANNAELPGVEGVTVPIGTSGQRPVAPNNGELRYNTTTAEFEGYANNAWGPLGGGGTVTSVGLVMPSDFNVTNSPITSTGNLTAAWASQTANYMLASPNGSSGTPSFRAMVNNDLPASGVTANTYGSTTAIPVLTVDDKGVITSATTASITGGLVYQGSWNALTNTPTLTSSVGTNGFYYVVSVAGTTDLNGITDWHVGDWAIFNGTVWQKIDQTNLVTSVNGQTGAVVITYGTLGTVPIADGGTGQTTATSAFNALAPSQTSNSGKYLTTDGTNTSWAALPINPITINSTTVTTAITIASGQNGFSVGPMTVGTGGSVTIASGQSWVIY